MRGKHNIHQDILICRTNAYIQIVQIYHLVLMLPFPVRLDPIIPTEAIWVSHAA